MIGQTKTVLFTAQRFDRNRQSLYQGRKQVSSPGIERGRIVQGSQSRQWKGKYSSLWLGKEGRQVFQEIKVWRQDRNR